MFSLELGYSVEKLDAAIQLSAQETYCISKWIYEISVRLISRLELQWFLELIISFSIVDIFSRVE